MQIPYKNLPMNKVSTVVIWTRATESIIQTEIKKIEVLLLRCSSTIVKSMAPKIPPKGMMPINNPCAKDDEKVMWYSDVRVSMGIVEISVRLNPNMRPDMEIMKPMKIIYSPLLYRF
jgi:hypothetical protein